MVSNDKSICQNCGSKLKRYDKVSRIVRTKGGKTSWIEIERFRCPVCGQIHRELPDYIFPYKQYEAEVIRGVLEGFITCETYGYEDYLCVYSLIDRVLKCIEHCATAKAYGKFREAGIMTKMEAVEENIIKSTKEKDNVEKGVN